MVSGQSQALCLDFLHLKQSPFFISSSLSGSGFGVLGFLHEDVVGDVGRGVEVRAAKRVFSSISLISARMQMLINSFRSVVHSLSIARYRSGLILCYRSSSRVSLL